MPRSWNIFHGHLLMATILTMEGLWHCLRFNSYTCEMKPPFTLNPILLFIGKIHVLVMAHSTKVYIMEWLFLYLLSPCCSCFLAPLLRFSLTTCKCSNHILTSLRDRRIIFGESCIWSSVRTPFIPLNISPIIVEGGSFIGSKGDNVAISGFIKCPEQNPFHVSNLRSPLV